MHAAGRRVHLDSRVAEQIVESTPGPEEHALRAETRGAVRTAVDTLNGRGRVVVRSSSSSSVSAMAVSSSGPTASSVPAACPAIAASMIWRVRAEPGGLSRAALSNRAAAVA